VNSQRDGRDIVIPVSNVGGSEFWSRPGDWGGIFTTQVPGVVIAVVAAVCVSQWVPGVKKLGLQFNHLSPSSSEAANEWSSACMPSYRAVCL